MSARDRHLDAIDQRLRYERFDYFLSRLRDLSGRPFEVAEHHRRWCELVLEHPRLVLLAPRDHSKSTTALAYVLWRCFRHGFAPSLGEPPGTYQAVLFSATHDQAHVLMARFRDLLAANAELFADTAAGPTVRTASSRSHVRLASGAEVLVRAWRTSTRGLHPDLVVLDDVLSDQNSLTEDQRTKTWRYFLETILPMHAAQILIVGTSLHADDLLHRLAPLERADADGNPVLIPILGFTWRRFPALLPDEQGSLWPSRHPYDELVALRDAEPAMFAREYQNDPRDDRASLFPSALTQRALDAGRELTFVERHRRGRNELIVLGADLARSGGIGADASVMMVVAWDVVTGTRRLLTARRERGLEFDEQVTLIRELCRDFGVEIGIIEDNGFQAWLVDELERYPETRGRIHGHTTTAPGKADVGYGVPRLKFELLHDAWIIPSGDPESLRFARVWQSELAAFGWRDGRLQGIGEHDDTVMATWFVTLAIRRVEVLLALPRDEIVTMEDLGIEPVRICAWDEPRRW